MSKATRVVIDGVSYPLNDTTAVDFSEAQSLNTAEKQQARTNIDAGSAADVASIGTAIGTVPSGSNLQGEVDDLKSAITKYNSLDITEYMKKTYTEHAGVTYTWNGSSCHAEGTSGSVGSQCVMLTSKEALPYGLKPGDILRAQYDGGMNFRLSFQWYKDGSTTAYSENVVTINRDVAIPSDAEGMRVRLYVPANTAVDQTATIHVLVGMTNDEIAENSVERVYAYSDMTEGGFWKLANMNALYFRDTERAVTDASFARLLIPVRKGDKVKLQTIAGASNAKPYAIIGQDRIISYIYTDSPVFTGTINIAADGWVAINSTVSNANVFSCRVISSKNRIAVESRLSNALVNEQYEMFPVYDDDNICRVLKTGPSLMGVFHHWGIIGASFDSGEFNWTKTGVSGAAELEWYEYSCWEYLKRINAIPDMYLYTDGGQNAKDWISLGSDTVRGYAYESNTEVVNPYWSGRHGIGPGGGCWWKMKSDHENGDTKQVYVVNLGSNDINNNYPHDENWNTLETYDETRYYTCGTIADIGTYDPATDTDTVPAGKTEGVIPGVVNSYAAYIGAVLNRIIAIQPDAIIMLATIRNSFDENQNRFDIWTEYNNTLKQIAAMDQYKNNVYILDNGKFGPSYHTWPMVGMIVGYHPNAEGYQYIAQYWNTLIDHCIQKNYRKFTQSMFIGTGKAYVP